MDTLSAYILEDTDMAIYTGVDGVMRELKGVAAAVSFVSYEMPVMKCGVGGVVRDLLNITDRIDHVEVSNFHVYVDTLNIDGDYVSVDGEDLATLNRYGSISFGTNSVQITCTTAKKRIFITYFIYVVFKDGLKTYLDDLLAIGGVTYTLSVTGYEYFTTDGWYQNVCLGDPVIEGYVSSSDTKTTTFTDLQDQTSGYLSTALKYSGTSRSKQTFNSIRINGKSIPVTVVNNLT